VFKNITILAAALGLIVQTACSGGGGSPSLPPSSPSAPSNGAPVVSISADVTAADEGRPFTLDASGSTDPDGDALSFTWTQTSGQAVEIREEGVRATITAPDVSQDGEIVIQVAVSDGTATTSKTISLTVQNIVLTPAQARLTEPLKTVQFAQRPVEVEVVSAHGNFAALKGLFTGSDGTDAIYYSSDENGTYTPTFTTHLTDEQIGLANSAYSDFIIENSLMNAYSLEGSGDIFLVGLVDPDKGTEVLSQFNVPNVCSITELGRDLVVGKRGGGLSYYSNSRIEPGGRRGAFAETQVLSEDEYCLLASGIEEKTYAFNSTTRMIEVWTRDQNTATLEISHQLDPELPANLHGVKLDHVYFLNQTFSNFHEAVMLLVTSGEHDGDHRLIVFHNPLRLGGAYTKTEVKWPKGIPNDFTWFENEERSRLSEIFISSSTIPYIVNVSVSGNPIYGDTYETYSEPVFLEHRLGATEIAGIFKWIHMVHGDDNKIDVGLSLSE
tara:strand:+ start:170 stop:1663 length:1494 start_codon:yes stop_codon:yes gene_type:complete